MALADFTQRFLFDQIDARGCYVKLEQTLCDIQATHHYPDNLGRTLNEFSLAAVLLRDSIKIDASVTVQLRTPGAIKLIMADCLADRRVRAVAEYDATDLAAAATLDLSNLGKDSVLAITISPLQGERYQSIVPIEHASLQECLEAYFLRSEQLPTLFSLTATKSSAVGITLHALPASDVTDETRTEGDFEYLQHLFKTLSAEEVMALEANDLLTRLFHQDSCRLFEKTEVEFGCHCSVERSLNAIRSLGVDELADLIEEQTLAGNESLEVDCHFCFQRYHFDFIDLQELLSAK